MQALASQMKVRFATAAVSAPLVVICTYLGGWWFVGLVHVACALAGWEWGTLLGGRSRVLPALTVLTALAFPVSTAIGLPTLAPVILGVAISLGVVLLPRTNLPSEPLFTGAVAMLGGTYAGALFAPSMVLRQTPDGLIWLTVIILGTWACDTGAFLVGKLWGAHKLAGPISPGKTVEGTVGGLIAAALTGAVIAVLNPDLAPRLVGLGVLVGVSAVAGDLLESGLKRRLQVKDSGWIMPGHGGFLDRIDSLLLASFMGYIFVAMTA
jgi:phosphatidate cytidylyltransferase